VQFVTKGWFPYDRYDHWQKRSAIVAIMWKPPYSDRSDHSNDMETSLYAWKLLSDQGRNDPSTFLVAIVAII